MAYKKKSEIDGSSDTGQGLIDSLFDNDEYIRALISDIAAGRLFLNNDFAIDQPNAFGSVAATAGVFGPDGVRLLKSGAGGFSGQAVTDTNLLTTRNHAKTGYKFTVTTAAASPGAGDYYISQHRVEGKRMKRFNYGLASANAGVLSFTALSSASITLTGALLNSASNRAYPWSTALSAGVATDVEIAVPGDTSGTWLTGADIGLISVFALGLGSTNGGTANAWTGSQKYGVAGAGLMATISNTLEITGLDFTVGDLAPRFYMPADPMLELARCKREYEQTFVGWHTTALGANQFANAPFQVEKLATPVMTSTSFSDPDASGQTVSSVGATVRGVTNVNLSGAPGAAGRRMSLIAIADSRL